MSAVEVGQQLPAQDFPITRYDLVRYAGASGDSTRSTGTSGSPNRSASQMSSRTECSLWQSQRVVTDWLGDPGAILEYGVRFTRPVVLPDPEGAVLHVEGEVREILADGSIAVDLHATVDGQTVLAKLARSREGGARR